METTAIWRGAQIAPNEPGLAQPCAFRACSGRTHDPLAMQKVVDSNPIIRSSRKPRSGGAFVLSGARRSLFGDLDSQLLVSLRGLRGWQTAGREHQERRAANDRLNHPVVSGATS